MENRGDARDYYNAAYPADQTLSWTLPADFGSIRTGMRAAR